MTDGRPQRDPDSHPAGLPCFPRARLALLLRWRGPHGPEPRAVPGQQPGGSEPFGPVTREELDPASRHVSELGSGPVLRRAFSRHRSPELAGVAAAL